MDVDHPGLRRLSAALRHAERSRHTDAIVHLSLKLIRMCKKSDDFALTRALATRRAQELIRTAPRHKAVRRLWHLMAPGRELVPLALAQVSMYSDDCRTRPSGCRVGTDAPRTATEPSYLATTLVVGHLSYVADLCALACACKTSRDAVAEAADARTHRTTPLCWSDVVASYRYGLKIQLPGGGTLSTKRVKEEVATGACFVDEHTDVFECMMRAYAAGKSRNEIVVGQKDARDIRNARDDVSVWLCAFGCFLAERNVEKCTRLLCACKNRRLVAEGLVALRM